METSILYGNRRLCLTVIAFLSIIPSLTVGQRKNRCIPYIYWAAAIFLLVTEYSNLFPSFTFFLNCFHFAFGYKLIICSKTAGIMKGICNHISFVGRDKSLFLNFNKIYCF